MILNKFMLLIIVFALTFSGQAAQAQYDPEEVRDIVWSPDGSHFAVAAFESIRVYDFAGNLVETLDISYADGLSWSPNNSTLAFSYIDGGRIVGGDYRIGRWDYLVNDSVQPLALVETGVDDIFWLPSGNQLLFYESLVEYVDGFLQRITNPMVTIDASNGNLLNDFNPGSATDMAFSPDGNYLAVIGQPQSELFIWDIVTSTQVGDPLTFERLSGLAWSTDSRYLVARENRGEELVVIDPFSDSDPIMHTFFMADIGTDNGARTVQWQGDTILANLGGPSPAFIALWSFSEKSLIKTIDNPFLEPTALSPDGNRVVYIDLDDSAPVVEVISTDHPSE